MSDPVRPSLFSAPTATNARADAPLLQIDNVTKLYVLPSKWGRARRFVRALDDVSLYLHEHETLGVVGESGSGKSTLGRVALRLTDVDYGQVAFNGELLTGLTERALRPMRRHAQPVTQNPRLALDPALSVLDIVREGVLASASASRAEERSLTWLNKVGLNRELAHRHPTQLSAGEAQRVVIARALAVEPRLLVLDEPVAALDISVRAQVINLLLDLQADLGLSYLFISHDLRVVRYVSHRTAVLHLGRVIETGPTQSVCDSPSHPYTRALLNSVPRVEHGRKYLKLLPEVSAPGSSTDGNGCRYRSRCPRAEPGRCDEEVPQLRPLAESSEHLVACHHPLQRALSLFPMPVEADGTAVAHSPTPASNGATPDDTEEPAAPESAGHPSDDSE